MTKKDLKTINFLICGHVDDGKSTLIGRLIYDLGVVPKDQISDVTDNQGKIDFSLFTDGLEDERRQGITIDVAYRYFRHEGYRYRISDTPGHIEYMKNMAVGAIGSDIAVIVVDAKQGVRSSTIEYSNIAKFFGINYFLIAVNKMDAVAYSKQQFEQIKSDYLKEFSHDDDNLKVIFIPVSAIEGDNIVNVSQNMPWYDGSTIFSYLKNYSNVINNVKSLCLPIQDVIKDKNNNRWYMGTLLGKPLTVGDKLTIETAEKYFSVKQIYHSGKSVNQCNPNDAVAIRIDKNIDISRGSVLIQRKSLTCFSHKFDANVLWLDAQDQRSTIQCIIKLHHVEVQAQIDIDIDNKFNALQAASIRLEKAVAIDVYNNTPQLGLFIAIDPNTQSVLMVGTIKSIYNNTNSII